MLYHKLGFTTCKLKVSDYETLLDKGFTRCGTYCYIRNQTMSCCECYQYKVKIADFKMSKSQRQTMKRFHRYLETGSVQKPVPQKEESKLEVDWSIVAAQALKTQLDSLISKDFPDFDPSKHTVRLNPKFKSFASNIMLVFKPNQNLPALFEKILQRKCTVANNFINVALTEDELYKLDQTLLKAKFKNRCLQHAIKAQKQQQ